MTKYFLTIFCLLTTIISNGQITSGVYKIFKDMDCGIKEGGMRIEKLVNKKFKFAIAVDGAETGEVAGEKMVMEGRIKGTATVIKPNVAVFKSKNCGTLTFYFRPNNKVEVKETNCDYYHGGNICFNGIYSQE